MVEASVAATEAAGLEVVDWEEDSAVETGAAGSAAG